MASRKRTPGVNPKAAPATSAGLAALTHRERQVVGYAVLGHSAKETAFALGISYATVRVLLARAARKLGTAGRAGLLAHPAVQSLSPQRR